MPPPSLSLHPSQGVSLGDTVTLRCHLPRVRAHVQLWLNGTLRSDKEKDKEQDTAEFSFAVTKLEDAGTYQCRYQVSEPLWTSNKSEPVELVVTGESIGHNGWLDPRGSSPVSSPPCTQVITSAPQQFPEPMSHGRMGTNLTPQSWNDDSGAACLLHSAEHSAPVQLQDPTGGAQPPSST